MTNKNKLTKKMAVLLAAAMIAGTPGSYAAADGEETAAATVPVGTENIVTAPVTIDASVTEPAPADTAEDEAAEEKSESFKAVYNVKKKPFGAKAGKDATEAIQKALDKAAKKATASKRVKVYIPAGTYYISKTLEINSNTYLQCDKKTKIIKKKKNGKRILYMLRSAKNGKKGKKGYNNVKNITVDGGSWDAKFIKFSKETGGSLFFFVHGKNLTFKNLELKNNYGTHLLELGGVTDVDINNCKMHGFKKSVKKEEKEAIQLDVCHSYKVLPDGGPFDDTACSNITIENNEVYDYPRAIGSHSYVKQIYPDNIIVKNNYFHNMTENAMYAYNYRNLTVSSNKFENVGQAVVFKTTAPKAEQTIYNRNKGVKAMSLPGRRYNLKVTDNTIKTTNKSVSANAEQFGIFIYGSKELSISGCTISGNTIKSASSGMYLKYVNNSTVENNKTYRTNNTTNKNFVLDAYKFLTCSNCTVSGNLADNSSGNMYENGIAFREACSNNTISGNTVINAQKHGIGVYGSTSVVSGNTITNAGQHGVAVIDGSTATVEGNTITSSAINGITVTNKAGATLKDNVITASGQHGISITDNNPTTISGNKISNSGINGVLLTNKAAADITGNTITDNKQHGISITENTSSSVTGNTISNNGGKGIIIANKGIASAVSNNKINGNKDRGLSVQDGTATVITGNELFDNNDKAIAINSSTVNEVSGNTMLSKNCEWEFTNEATNCKAESFRTVTVNPVAAGATAITGACQLDATVYAMINGEKIPGSSAKKILNIVIKPQPAGTPVAVYQEDAFGNKVVVNVTL